LFLLSFFSPVWAGSACLRLFVELALVPALFSLFSSFDLVVGGVFGPKKPEEGFSGEGLFFPRLIGQGRFFSWSPEK